MDSIENKHSLPPGLPIMHKMYELAKKVTQIAFFVPAVWDKYYSKDDNDLPPSLSDKAVGYAWNAKVFEDTLKGVSWGQAIPSIGNGYVESIAKLLEAIDEAAQDQEGLRINQTSLLVEGLDENLQKVLLAKDTYYPMEIYFIALDILYRRWKSAEGASLPRTPWMVTMSPNYQTQLAAIKLITSSKLLFSYIRDNDYTAFWDAFQGFDKAWNDFVTELVCEYKHNKAYWRGSLEMLRLIESLASNKNTEEIYKWRQADLDSLAKVMQKVAHLNGRDKEVFFQHLNYFLTENIRKIQENTHTFDLNSKIMIRDTVSELLRDPYLNKPLFDLLRNQSSQVFTTIPLLACLRWCDLNPIEENLPPAMFLEHASLVRQLHQQLHTLSHDNPDYALPYLQCHLLFPLSSSKWTSKIINLIARKKVLKLIPLRAWNDLELKSDEIKSTLDKLSVAIKNGENESLYDLLNMLIDQFQIKSTTPLYHAQSLAKRILQLGITQFDRMSFRNTFKEVSVLDMKK